MSIAALGLRWWDASRTVLVALAMIAPAMVAILAVLTSVILGFTLPQRWPFVIAVCVGVVVGAGVLIVATTGVDPPRFVRWCPTPTESAGTPGDAGTRLVVYGHNIQWKNGAPSEVAAQLEEQRPDLVVLTEADDGFGRSVMDRTDGEWYVQGNRFEGTLSLVVMSRWPISAVEERESDDRNPVLLFTVEHPVGPVRVAAVHTTAPTSSYRISRWKREFDELSTIEADLMVGDFNASAAHRGFRSVLAAGWVDVHREVGCGPGLTWSPFPGPSLLHLDHILIRRAAGSNESAPLRPVEYRSAGRAGSDHRAVIAVLEIPDR